MKRYIIDRFEGSYAVCECEDLSHVNIEKKLLPKGCSEGDCIILKNNKYILDSDETKKRKKRIEDKMNKLFE